MYRAFLFLLSFPKGNLRLFLLLSVLVLHLPCPQCGTLKPTSGRLALRVLPNPTAKGAPNLMASSHAAVSTFADPNQGYKRFLLLVAGLGGLLYGVDVGIIGGALPYLEATSGLSAGQLSAIVAAVLLGSVFSTLFAGILADSMGRKPLMILSGITFVLSIPVISLSHGYGPLLLGRLLQGISGGLIGVVVPLYLAECLAANVRGKGTGIFQWLLTLGIVSAALIGIYYSYRVVAVEHTSSPAALLQFKDQAWRRIFWVSLPPGLLFVAGSFFVSESPRWLFRKGRLDAARAALLRSRTPAEADLELAEMQAIANEKLRGATSTTGAVKDSLLRRKYVIPFVLACVILTCNTATGINSIIGYNTAILLQSGLSDLHAHWGYVLFTLVNFLFTLLGLSLVDRKGRRFLFILGTSGILISLVVTGLLFVSAEHATADARAPLQSLVDTATNPAQPTTLPFTPAIAAHLLLDVPSASKSIDPAHASLAVIYTCGDFTSATPFVRSDDRSATPITLSRAACLPSNPTEARLKNPFANLDASRNAPLRVQRAIIGAIPSPSHGYLVALFLYLFMASFAVGPGVCVWLALSELMPTRIRSNGMSLALVLNQAVSTTLAAIFLPFVANHGYSRMFFLFAAFTLVYLVVATLFIPETKGKTLEEIEAHFEGNVKA